MDREVCSNTAMLSSSESPGSNLYYLAISFRGVHLLVAATLL